jgi:CARDB protein
MLLFFCHRLKMFSILKCCCLVALVSAALSAPAQLSSSHISAHLINAYTAGSSNIIAGHPRVLKILDLGGDMLQAARDYKAATPSGKIVLRIYTPFSYPNTADPGTSATNFWTTILQPPINSLSASDRALIDYLEGPNEGDSTPTWGSLGDAQWFTGFWTNLSPLIAAAGFKPCIGSIAVGNPGGDPSQIQALISTFVPALRQAKALGGAWSYHAYTLNYTTDANLESYYSLRYRQYYSQFASQFPDLVNMPLILTEGGVDQSGTPATSGWQARGTAADYERWLNWFDRQIGQDSYVLGCTLFEIGNPSGWSSFDLEPIGLWMRNYLTAPTAAPQAPTGLTGIPTNATAVLQWTSAPTSPTTYNVKRARTSGGAYTTIASGVTEGVKATTYTDSGVTNGGTYYYVVSAVNAFGESANSTQVTVTMPNINLPDVIVTAVAWTPNPPYAGNHIVFRATVKNQGSASTPSGTTLGVGFSIDGSANVSWSGGYSSALAPGASVTLIADGGPTGNYWAATAGPHTLVATADDINRFPESNENNNSMSAYLAISTGPPRINSFSVTNQTARFSFTATTGLHYQAQYKTNLADVVWQNLGVQMTAASATVSIADPVTATQKFYRVLQQN